MLTTEEQITYLAQQLNAMQTDVAELQNAQQGSATKCADLTVQLFTREPRVRRVMEAGDEATTSQTWSGEKGSESFTAFKMELQNWVGSLHDIMLKVMDVADAKEGRLMELDIKNAGLSQETVDDFKEVDRIQYQVLISCTKGDAKN